MAFVKWLRYLIFVAVISIILSVLNCFKIMPNSPFFIWISTYDGWIISAISIYCLFRLACVNNRYKKASIYRFFNFVCVIASYYLRRIISNVNVESIISLGSLLFNIIAFYQEYTAHAEIVIERDTLLASKLRQLFYLVLVLNIILPIVITSINPALSTNGIAPILTNLFNILTLLVRVVCLKRMVRIFTASEE